MDKTNANLLFEKIQKFDNIIISKHKTPDWDALGSAEGLRNIISDNFKNKNIFVVGATLDGTGLSDDEKLTPEIIKAALLITVDTANIERLDFENFGDVKESFRIDHHINNTPYTDFEYIFSDAIACTQVITLWANEMQLKISKTAAEYLYRGLLTDSNRFAYRNTDERTFEAAKILTRCGINIAEITQDIYKRTLRQAQWSAEAFGRIVIDAETKFAYIIADYKDIKKYNLTNDEFKSALGAMGNIIEIDVWALIYELTETSGIKVSLRSKKIDINKIAMKYGGGGHLLASGGYLDSWDDLDAFLLDVKNYLKGEK
jgi:phosphoesterase RecJ-like protein